MTLRLTEYELTSPMRWKCRGSDRVWCTNLVVVALKSRFIAKEGETALLKDPNRGKIVRHREGTDPRMRQIMKGVAKGAGYELCGEPTTPVRWVEEVADLQAPSRVAWIDTEPTPSNDTAFNSINDYPRSEAQALARVFVGAQAS